MRKTAIGLLIAIILCSGCGNGNAGENISEELQVTEENLQAGQQTAMSQQEVIEEQATESEDKPESEQAVDSVSAEELNEKSEENTNVRHDSIDQLEIQGRTQEETELIQKILSEDKKEFEEFLTTEWGDSHEMESISIGAYDFTGDGADEIIMCEFYVNISTALTYNYVYDQKGRRILEFVSGGEDEIIVDWDGEGTFLLYTMNHYAAHYDADIYTEIRYENDALTEKVILMELDRRYGGDEGKEEYYIFKDFTKEEEEKLWYGASGVDELTKTKECFKEGEEPEAYRKLFDEKKTDPNYFPVISTIAYSEEDGFVELIEVLTYYFTQDGRKVLGWQLQAK